LIHSFAAVIELAAKNDPGAVEFFEHEYQTDHFIATMTTPFVSIMNGITSECRVVDLF
jgi:enoyl-CoA hydratase/carnithine racemase